MRGYGLPRNDDVSHPDKGDIALYGLSFQPESGRTSARRRRASRRTWKKKYRQAWKRELMGAGRRYERQVI